MLIAGRYIATGKSVRLKDAAYGDTDTIARAVDDHQAALIATALNFLCVTAAEAVGEAEAIYTYADHDPRL